MALFHPKSGGRVFFTFLLTGVGLWYAVTGRAKFALGGDEYGRRAIAVDARGLDAVAIGCFFIGLGIVNLALAVAGNRRIPVFWTGAGLMIAAALYGAAMLFT